MGPFSLGERVEICQCPAPQFCGRHEETLFSLIAPRVLGPHLMTGGREMMRKVIKNVKGYKMDAVLADCAQDFNRKLLHKPLGKPQRRILLSGPAGAPSALSTQPTPTSMLLTAPCVYSQVCSVRVNFGKRTVLRKTGQSCRQGGNHTLELKYNLVQNKREFFSSQPGEW